MKLREWDYFELSDIKIFPGRIKKCKNAGQNYHNFLITIIIIERTEFLLFLTGFS